MSIRIIHHWACSGGTIISRAIASLPNVVLLSEVHPLAYLRLADAKPGYAPTDIIQQLCLSHNEADPVLCVEAWRGAITALANKVEKEGKVLVLRNHSHIDFFTGAQPETEHFVTRSLNYVCNLNELLTVRHPLDSWISMQRNNWHRHFCFGTFEEFCCRAISLVIASEGLPIIRYEEFSIDPQKGLRTICRLLDIRLEADQLVDLGSVSISGDSGRSSCQIEPRERRPVSEPIQFEIDAMEKQLANSSYYRLCNMLGYDPKTLAKHPFLLANHQLPAIVPIIH